MNGWNETIDFIRQNISVSQAVLFRLSSISTRSGENIIFAYEINEEHRGVLTKLMILNEKLKKLIVEYDKATRQSAVDK